MKISLDISVSRASLVVSSVCSHSHVSRLFKVKTFKRYERRQTFNKLIMKRCDAIRDLRELYRDGYVSMNRANVSKRRRVYSLRSLSMSPGFLAAGPFGFFRIFTSRPDGGVGTSTLSTPVTLGSRARAQRWARTN